MISIPLIISPSPIHIPNYAIKYNDRIYAVNKTTFSLFVELSFNSANLEFDESDHSPEAAQASSS